MKAKQFVTALAIWAVFAGGEALYAQKTYSLQDPTGRIGVTVEVSRENVTYSVKHDGEMLIAPSAISMTLSDGTVFGAGPKVKKAGRRSVDGEIYPPVYRKTVIDEEYNELSLDFRGGYSIVFRAYPDGAAYRFVSHIDGPFNVKSEEASFRLPEDWKVYAGYPRGRMNEGKPDPFYSSFQCTYEHISLSEWEDDRAAVLPVLVETDSGKKICITEADLMDYPGMYLCADEAKSALEGVFPAYPDRIVPEVRGLKGVVKSRHDYIARVSSGETAFPWRAVIVADDDRQLLDNDMVYKLATPPAEGSDFSWVRPGKVAWEWWNNWGIYDVPFRAGINTETYKYYIDFASGHGIEYVILDEGWSVPGAADLMQIVPEIDLEEIIRYADSRNVGIILWAGYLAFDKDMDNVCRHYSEMGVKGFKIDFMDRDDQMLVDFNRRAAETGAKYRLLIDLHGTYKPTGLQRTWPNTINFEGVFGLEEVKWAGEGFDQVTYDVTFPFIRMVAGPVDYTQGAMKNANRDNFKAVYTEPMSQGTRCRQLAEYMIFDSPVAMLCDSPSNYMRERECTGFIAEVPTVWDKTLPLQARVGEYIVTARQADDVWYVGGITDWTARDIKMDFSFLEPGDYTVELFRDGVNADMFARDYIHETAEIDSGSSMEVHLAPGGGFAMKITKRQ